MLRTGVRAGRAEVEGSSQAGLSPKGRACIPQNPLPEQIPDLLSSFHTEALAPQCFHGPPLGSNLWSQRFEVGNLPSTRRKIKAKGNFKARLCDKPKAETCLMATLSLPGPLPLISAHQGLGGMRDVWLQKSLLRSSLPLSWTQHQVKKQMKYLRLGSFSLRG